MMNAGWMFSLSCAPAVARRVASLLVVAAIASACGSAGAPSSTSLVVPVSVAPTTTVEPQEIELSVREFVFSTDHLEADAGRPIIIAFSNEDGVKHNVQLWRDDTREEKVFFGELIDGPATIEYELGPLEPGTYRFECAPHAGTMIGHLVVADPGP